MSCVQTEVEISECSTVQSGVQQGNPMAPGRFAAPMVKMMEPVDHSGMISTTIGKIFADLIVETMTKPMPFSGGTTSIPSEADRRDLQPGIDDAKVHRDLRWDGGVPTVQFA